MNSHGDVVSLKSAALGVLCMNPCAKRQLNRRYEQNVENCNGTLIVEPECYIKFLKIQRITDITESIENRYNYCLFCVFFFLRHLFTDSDKVKRKSF